MYLKSLEATGFKSFADKTKLEFEPGMTAIVGPNGCGKSNVSDALRWVLGEQSAKALRGSQMVDCIFNGTDDRKQMGMAEVSVTFSDCEKTLKTEYNEVTITRRVFRSGEGQYFLNKTPCRLKDIRRLFMDTGIGTNSYSMLEQGRIDHVLSSRPEDRRAIFEEASGIMKYKADKLEATRKLEHTEANLLRLSDVIREVKRQIGSLQRQAGKARRYTTLRDELRAKDLFLTRERIGAANTQMESLEKKIALLSGKQDGVQTELKDLEGSVSGLREGLVQLERQIGSVMEEGVQAKGRLDHTREMMDVNRQRIAEFNVLSQRDTTEIEAMQTQLTTLEQDLEKKAAETTETDRQHVEAKQDLSQAQQQLDEYLQHVESLRTTIQAVREQAVELETTATRLQNELLDIESQERQSVIQKERLAAEKSQCGRLVESFEARQQEMTAAVQTLDNDYSEAAAGLQQIRGRRAAEAERRDALREDCARLKSADAAETARLEMLQESASAREGLPEGARLLLDTETPASVDRAMILGALASRIEGQPGYEQALEAVLGSWIDAVLVKDEASALSIIRDLSGKQAGSVHLLSCEASDAEQAPAVAENGLLQHVNCPDAVRPVLQRLIGNVSVVEDIADVPSPVPADRVFVTRAGVIRRGSVEFEYCSQSDNADSLLTVKHRMAESDRRLMDTRISLEKAQADLDAVTAGIQALDASLQESADQVDAKKQAVSQKRGELDIVTRETEEAKNRLETVTWELEELNKRSESGVGQQEAIRERIAEVKSARNELSDKLHALTDDLKSEENRGGGLQAAMTEKRIRFSELSQRQQHLQHQRQTAESRAGDLRSAIQGRSSGISSYRSSIAELENQIRDAEGRVTQLEESVIQHRAHVSELEKSREDKNGELHSQETLLAAKRSVLEDLRGTRSETEISLTEIRMRRQNQIERITSDYKITLEDVLSSEEPEWEGEAPSHEALETSVAELRTKLEAMGPVNLVAIEEYHELEERFAFLTAQEQDLTNSKQQLMEMIKKINRTTSEMFRTTFDQINVNFEEVYKKLFNGGTAKLVLVDDEEVLESGIEIIARPPGKKLQNVSLLSGGERTMTAVALLFAIYMIKPSPFCLLDELDAALDESNISRFVAVLQSFLTQSQFVIITHNRKTIAAADVLYGVTMPNKGVSRIVAMKFRDFEPAGVPEPVAAGV